MLLSRSARFLRHFRSGAFLAFCLPCLMLLAGCGTGAVMNSAPPPITITASAATVAAGGSTTLSVSSTDTTQVTITGSDGSSYTLPANGGTQKVSPTSTTTYTAIATGAGGGKVSATITIVVTAAPAATTATIVANPVSVAPGGSSVLTVTASNATQVTVAGSDGSSYTLAPTGGTQSVSPATTTTYTATATGTGGQVTATATVTVTSAPTTTVTIASNPASISSGASSVLSVTATNATQVTVTGSDNSSYPLQPNGGTLTVSPAATTTYTASATGASGKVTAMATVTVTPVTNATVSISANPTSISAGGSSTLTIVAANATQVTLTGTDGTTSTLPSTGGTQPVIPKATTTYTAVATGAGGATVSATVTVAVIPSTIVAPTVAISAMPTSTSGGPSVLTVTATNATQVTVAGSDGSSYTLTSTGGMQTVTPSATTTYTATATGAGGTVSATATITVAAPATVTVVASPNSITPGASSVLTVTATNATQVTVTGSDGSTYPSLPASGGTLNVTPTATTTYTANATGAGSPASAKATVTVTAPGNVQSITHVIFMLQENHTFDNYFGMLNPYRTANNMSVGDDGKTYSVDGIDDKLKKISNENDEGTSYSPFKLTSSCVDDMTSGWLESYGDINRYDFSTTRKILMDGFVHTAEGYAKTCQQSGGTSCSGTIHDLNGERSMGYYDGGFLNYYYYMASQFALSDRWFSPMSSKSIPNRIATFTGGTTQGLVLDPGNNDKLSQLPIPTIFGELQRAGVSWKIYYTVSQGGCLSDDECGAGGASFPATIFTYLSDSGAFLYQKTTTAPTCTGTTQDSSLPPVNDSSNSFCIDIHHIAPLASYYSDLTNGTLPSFSFIEAGYGNSDEHPGSGQSMLAGQQEVASIVNALMKSTEWMQSVFFLSYDEGGGPYDHVPPVPTHSNDYTDATVGGATTKTDIPDIGSIAVNADSFKPCVPATPGTATEHCDLPAAGDPGDTANDAPAVNGFAAQLGFRVPNLVISPFTKRHYVSHIPMDHTAIIKFVESRFIGPSANLTARDAAQPNLLDFFDFTNTPWATPPAPPTPNPNLGPTCTPLSFGGP